VFKLSTKPYQLVTPSWGENSPSSPSEARSFEPAQQAANRSVRTQMHHPEISPVQRPLERGVLSTSRLRCPRSIACSVVEASSLLWVVAVFCERHVVTAAVGMLSADAHYQASIDYTSTVCTCHIHTAKPTVWHPVDLPERARQLGHLSSLTPARVPKKLGRCTGLKCDKPITENVMAVHFSARGVMKNLGSLGRGNRQIAYVHDWSMVRALAGRMLCWLGAVVIVLGWGFLVTD